MPDAHQATKSCYDDDDNDIVHSVLVFNIMTVYIIVIFPGISNWLSDQMIPGTQVLLGNRTDTGPAAKQNTELLTH